MSKKNNHGLGQAHDDAVKYADEAAARAKDTARSEQEAASEEISANAPASEPSKEEPTEEQEAQAEAALIEHISGLDKSAAMKHLLVVEDMSFAKSEKFWNKHGVNARKNTREMINDYLAESPRNEREFYTHIIDNGTKNDARWISQLNNTRKLTWDIFARFLIDDMPSELSATDNQKQLVKDILR